MASHRKGHLQHPAGNGKLEILDENNFRALLRVKMMGSQWVLKLKGEMVDISPPNPFP